MKICIQNAVLGLSGTLESRALGTAVVQHRVQELIEITTIS